MVILKSRVHMEEEDIKKHEDKLTKKIGKKVVIIPCDFDVIKLDFKRNLIGRKIW